MSVREVRRRSAYDHALKSLSKKHRSLPENVEGLLTRIAAGGPTPNCDQLEGMDDRPVYKVRVPIEGMGLRKAARLIYFCDHAEVVALFIFVKGDKENVPQKEIREALKAAGLL